MLQSQWSRQTSDTHHDVDEVCPVFHAVAQEEGSLARNAFSIRNRELGLSSSNSGGDSSGIVSGSNFSSSINEVSTDLRGHVGSNQMVDNVRKSSFKCVQQLKSSTSSHSTGLESDSKESKSKISTSSNNQEQIIQPDTKISSSNTEPSPLTVQQPKSKSMKVAPVLIQNKIAYKNADSPIFLTGRSVDSCLANITEESIYSKDHEGDRSTESSATEYSVRAKGNGKELRVKANSWASGTGTTKVTLPSSSNSKDFSCVVIKPIKQKTIPAVNQRSSESNTETEKNQSTQQQSDIKFKTIQLSENVNIILKSVTLHDSTHLYDTLNNLPKLGNTFQEFHGYTTNNIIESSQSTKKPSAEFRRSISRPEVRSVFYGPIIREENDSDVCAVEKSLREQ